MTFGKLLGSGCSGYVYEGRYNGRPVAIKQFINHNKDNLEAIIHELEILALMDHPNIISLYGYVLGDQREIWVITELAKSDLLKVLKSSGSSRRSILPYKTRKSYIQQITNGLLYTITHGILHQDLKTDNILIDMNGRIKIADFGLSQLMRSPAGESPSVSSTRRSLDRLSRAGQLSAVEIAPCFHRKKIARGLASRVRRVSGKQASSHPHAIERVCVGYLDHGNLRGICGEESVEGWRGERGNGAECGSDGCH